MSWIGKLIGGSIGLAIGGPLGAVLGAAIGHSFVDTRPSFDHPPQHHGRASRLSSHEERQTVFFATTFSMLGKMAKADGRVSDQEIRAVDEVIRHRLRLDADARRLAVSIFNEAKDNEFPFSAYARQFGTYFAHDTQMRVLLFELLLTVAQADGSLHPNEDALLREAVSYLGLPRSTYDGPGADTDPNLAPLYTMLGCDRSASDEEVKKCYRRRVNEFHPDKVISKGLPEEFTKFAEEKFKEINHAYETIVKHRKSRNS